MGASLMAPTTPTIPCQLSSQLTLRRRRQLCRSTTQSTTATTATTALSPTTMVRGRQMLRPMPRLTPGWHTVATLDTPMPTATLDTFPMSATPSSRPSLASTSSPPSPPTTALARGPLRQSPRLMLRLRPTLGWHTDTPATDTDSDTDTDSATDTAAATSMDTPAATDTVDTDIPTTDNDIAARFLYGYLPRYYPNVFREPISKC